MVNGLNPGVSIICLAWSSTGWGLSLERLLVTDNNSLSKDYPHSDDHAKQLILYINFVFVFYVLYFHQPRSTGVSSHLYGGISVIMHKSLFLCTAGGAEKLYDLHIYQHNKFIAVV